MVVTQAALQGCVAKAFLFRVGLRLCRSGPSQAPTKVRMPQHSKLRRSVCPKEKGILVASLLFVSVTLFHKSSQQNQKPHPPERAIINPVGAKTGERSADQSAPLLLPFHEGEVLNYRLTWSVFLNAAAVQLSVVEWRDLRGTPTWHFRATAHTQVPLRSLAEVDDQFDSYAETESLESRQYETYLAELGEKQNTVLRLASTNVAKKNRGATVLVKPHTRDPLAALYLLRTLDWQRTPEFRAPVYDGEDLYEMSARVESAAESVSVSGHSVKATKVSVRLFRAGQQSRTRCSIWFSQDGARIPLLIEADVPYGRVRAELVSKAQ
jgi:hypothetical protein